MSVTVRSILEGYQKELGSSSIVVYVEDPSSKHDLILLEMIGVRYPEPMHGYLFPKESRSRVCGGDDFIWMQSADSIYTEDDSIHLIANHSHLFGSYAVRENVGAYARIIKKTADGISAVVFFNFTTPYPVCPCSESMLSCMQEITTLLPGINTHLRQIVSKYSRRMIEILKVTEQLAQLQLGNPDERDTLSNYFSVFLDKVLETLNIKQSGGFGSIHIVSPDGATLALEASVPGSVNRHQVQSIVSGEGIVPWVALRRRAIMINNMETSEFNKIFHPLRDVGTQSELAVPMIVGEKVIGVLNIESPEKDAFETADVKTIWYAANQAAIAFELCRHASSSTAVNSMLAELLDARSRANSSESPERFNDLSIALAKHSGANMCDIWKYHESGFLPAGTSDSSIDTKTPPRRDGWSDYIATKCVPIWIASITSSSDFVAFEWSGSAWSEVPENTPRSLHRSLTILNVACEIGVPVVVDDRVIGVAWLKYSSVYQRSPVKHEVENILRLASAVGLMYDIMSSHRLAKELEERIRAFSVGLFPASDSANEASFDIAVRSEPCGASIGGDFYGWTYLDSLFGRLAVIIGDGEGHGLEGAFQMLPLLTAWRILSSEKTTSTNYVLQNMNRVAIDMNVKGTALYFIIDTLSGKKFVLSGSNAGHPEIMRINSRTGANDDFPPTQGIDVSAPMLGIELPSPLGEAIMEFDTGDVLIAYTDGLKDAGEKQNPSKPFGRLGVLLAALPVLGESADEIAASILEAARRSGFHDDATVLVVKQRTMAGVAGSDG